MTAEDADVETASADYARRFAGPVGAWFLEVQSRATLELLGAWPGAHVLDVGGGHGQVTAPLLDSGYEVTIYGSSVACRERVAAWVDRGRARFQSGDLLKLPWADGAVDVCLSYRLLAHLARWHELAAELCRVARRGVLIDYPSRRSVNAVSRAFFGLKQGVEGNARRFTVFRDAEIVEAFAAHGFHVTGRRPQFLLPMAVHRALRIAPLSRALERGASALGLTASFGSPVILRLEPLGRTRVSGAVAPAAAPGT